MESIKSRGLKEKKELAKPEMGFSSSSQAIPVLLLGNNPIGMSEVFNMLMGYRYQKFSVSTAFNLGDGQEKLIKDNPAYILIDDSFGSQEIKRFLELLNANKVWREMPVTLLKSNNEPHAVYEGITDFLLKEELAPEALGKSLLRNLKYKKNHEELSVAYEKGKKKIKKMIQDRPRYGRKAFWSWMFSY